MDPLSALLASDDGNPPSSLWGDDGGDVAPKPIVPDLKTNPAEEKLSTFNKKKLKVKKTKSSITIDDPHFESNTGRAFGGGVSSGASANLESHKTHEVDVFGDVKTSPSASGGGDIFARDTPATATDDDDLVFTKTRTASLNPVKDDNDDVIADMMVGKILTSEGIDEEATLFGVKKSTVKQLRHGGATATEGEVAESKSIDDEDVNRVDDLEQLLGELGARGDTKIASSEIALESALGKSSTAANDEEAEMPADESVFDFASYLKGEERDSEGGGGGGGLFD